MRTIAKYDHLSEDEWQVLVETSGRPDKFPPDHIRCTRIMRDGGRCRKTRMPGAQQCSRHSGRQQQKARRNEILVRHDLPRFYRKQMSGTLSKFVEECLESPPHEQLSLYEELAAIRHQAQQSVALYNVAVAVSEQDSLTELQRGAAQQALTLAGQMMKEQLRDVAEMSQKAASVEHSAKDKISIHHIAFVINQIVRISHEVLGDHPELAQAFERAVRDRVKAPSEVTEGVDLTPDALLEDVMDMDSTIPSEPQELVHSNGDS